MRIAVTHPTCWPEVRRGAERHLDDIGRVLAARGHEVTAISTGPDGPGEEARGAVRHVFLQRRSPAALFVRTGQVNFLHGFAWELRRFLLTEPFDAVFCLGWHDALGALAARRGGARFRLALELIGIPIRRYFRRTPLDGLLFARVLSGVDVLTVVSRFAAERLRAEYGFEGVLLPSPIDTAAFSAVPKPVSDGCRRVLFVGDADEPRKGALLLARAYAMARPRLGPLARLGYSGRLSEATRAMILAALPEGLHHEVDFHGLGAPGSLPGLLAGASVVVNPAVWEALGMVLIEALAAGTPVVGCEHAGIPDIIDDPRIGAMFEPGPFRRASANAQGLAEAVLHAVTLATRPETAALCRSRAEVFSWNVLAPRYEALLAPVGASTAGGVR